MRPRTTLLLLLIVILLGAFIVLWERRQPGSEERRELALRLLPATYERPELERITRRRGDELVVIERVAGDGWRFEEPLRDHVSAERLDRILDGLEAVEILGRVPANELAGLPGDAVLELSLSQRGRAPVEIVLLSRRLADAHVYARIAGAGEFVVVPASLESELSFDLDELREERVATFDADGVGRMWLEGPPAEPISFARREGSWWVEAPYADEADASRVRALLDALLSLRADRFSPAELTGPPWLTLRAESRDGSDLPLLELGAQDESAASRRWAQVEGRPGSMRVDARPLARLLATDPESWRSLLVLDFAPSEIVGVRLEEGERSLSITRQDRDAAWSGAALESGVDQDRVDEALFQLSRVEALGVLGPARARELERARAGRTLVLERRGASPIELLLFEDPASPSKVIAKRADRAPFFEVAAGPFALLDQASLTVSKTNE